MKTKKINQAFTCEHCGCEVMEHPSSSRNHCNMCLYSKHVDLDIPGDRLSKCQGLMRPIRIEYTGKKGYIVVQECGKCGKIMKNIVAEDDNKDIVIELTKPNN